MHDPIGVDVDGRRHGRGVDGDAVCAEGGERLHRAAQNRGNRDAGDLQFDLAGFEPLQIEDVFNQRHQTDGIALGERNDLDHVVRQRDPRRRTRAGRGIRESRSAACAVRG